MGFDNTEKCTICSCANVILDSEDNIMDVAPLIDVIDESGRDQRVCKECLDRIVQNETVE